MKFMGLDFGDTRNMRSGLDLGVFYCFGGCRSRRCGFNGFGGFYGFNNLDGVRSGNQSDKCRMEKGLITNDHK